MLGSICGAIKKFTAPSAKYEIGNISTREEVHTSQQVARLESYAKEVSDAFRRLDETAGDLNGSNPGNAAGSVYRQWGGPNQSAFVGQCKFEGENTKSLKCQAGSTDLSVSSSGDHKEIHLVERISGCGRDGWGQVETHQWAIFDGNQVKYKNYDTFT